MHQTGGDVVAEGDPVVAVVVALAQQAARGAVAGDGDEQAHVGAVRVVGDRLQGRGVVLGQVALGLRRHDDPLDGDGAPGDLLGPGDPGQQVLEARRPRGSSSCSTALSAPSTASWVARPVGELGLLGEELGRRDEGEQAHRLVPPGAGDVPLGVERGEGQGVGHGPGGVGHRTMVPDQPRRRPGYIARPRSTRGAPPPTGRGEQ